MRVLHIIPRWIGGGPERHLLELARHDGDRAVAVERRLLILDRPISAPFLVRARRQGIAVVSQPWRDVVEREVELADVVDVTFWNHPELLELLRRPLPAARILFQAAIAGHTMPQVVFPELFPIADAWVLAAPSGHGSTEVAAQHGLVVHIPALADMGRLDGYAPRDHTGVRTTYLGSLTEAKLHPEFPRIVALVANPNVTFELFGDADGETLSRLRQRLWKAGVAERVALRGHVENLTEAFAEADIFVYPLTPGSYVASEKALQEAMWVGIPPVLLGGTAAVGWVESGVAGIVAPDIDSFAAQLDRLASDPSLRERMGRAARAFARSQFDPRANARRFWGVFEQILALPKSTRAPLTGFDSHPWEKFLQSLGDLAPQFTRMVAATEHPGASSMQLLLRGEGGVMHYWKTYPHDETLRAWAEVLRRTEAHTPGE